MTAVVVAVLTFKRPHDLAEVLPLLGEQARLGAEDGFDVRIVVVDNDPAASAASTVAAFGAASSTAGVDAQYVHEPEPNIALARNRALDAARGSDVIVFIDDDERPSDRWLVQLLATWRRERTTAVVGPVVSTFAVPPNRFIEAGGYFNRRRLPTGSRIEVAATNNLLLDLAEVQRLGLRFDRAFGTTGGEDGLFTRQLVRRGGTMVWCDEAIVVDVVPAPRVTTRWVVLRALSSGNSWGLVSVRLAESFVERTAVRVRVSGQGLVRLAGGAVQAVAGVVRRRDAGRARGVRTIARGAGMVLGAWGYRYHEYRAPSAAVAAGQRRVSDTARR